MCHGGAARRGSIELHLDLSIPPPRPIRHTLREIITKKGGNA